MGGRIDVASEVGTGSDFRFTIRLINLHTGSVFDLPDFQCACGALIVWLPISRRAARWPAPSRNHRW
jgi:hypothetical protein